MKVVLIKELEQISNMSMRIVWKGYDPFVHRFAMAWNAYGPTTSFKKMEFVQMRNILVLVMPRFAWAWEIRGNGWLEGVLESYMRTGTVPEDAKGVYDEIMGVYVPEEAVEIAKEREQKIRREFSRAERALIGVGRKIYGERAVTGEVAVYVAPKAKRRGAEGIPLTDDVIALFVGLDESSTKGAVIVLTHEIIHVFNRRSGFAKILEKIGKKTGLPADEAFTQTVTNLVLWRAGLSEEMFGVYYAEDWEELKELEDKVREIVREWWLNGGDLRRMLEGRLGR